MTRNTILLGYDNYINKERIVAVLNVTSAPAQRYIKRAEEQNILIDVTAGRKRLSILVTDMGLVFVTAKAPKTLSSMIDE